MNTSPLLSHPLDLPDPGIDWAKETDLATAIIHQLVTATLYEKKWKPRILDQKKLKPSSDPSPGKEKEEGNKTLEDAKSTSDDSQRKKPNKIRWGLVRYTCFPARESLTNFPQATLYPDEPCLISWKIRDWGFSSTPDPEDEPPIKARGLLVRKVNGGPQVLSRATMSDPDCRYEIMVRGYDKIRSLNHVPKTQYAYLHQYATGPFLATVKENGCVIYISATAEDRVLITSKHSVTSMHAMVGGQWLDRHLLKVHKSRSDLAAFLFHHRCTAALELADDSFEEHVFPYPPDLWGLWLHGIHYNTVEFKPVPMNLVPSIAEHFGFHVVPCIPFSSLNEMLNYAYTCKTVPAVHPEDPQRDIEGWVFRYTHKDTGDVCLFKYKHSQPYMLYREWREIALAYVQWMETTACQTDAEATKHIKTLNEIEAEILHFMSYHHLNWVKSMYATDPEMFAGLKDHHGGFAIRNAYLDSVKDMNFGGGGGKDISGTGLTILVTVASIGVGKTTLGAMLAKQFPDLVYHVQSDNIERKASQSARKLFHKQVLKALNTHPVVYADRNNHTLDMRNDLVYAINEVYPNATIIFLEWQINQDNQAKVIQWTKNRVTERGENHQTFRPKHTPMWESVIKRFVYDRDTISLQEIEYQNRPFLSGDVPIFVSCLQMSLFCPTTYNYKLVVHALSQLGVIREATPLVITDAQLDLLITQVRKTSVSVPSKRPKYYGLAVPPDQILAVLNNYKLGQEKPLILKETFHVTLVHLSDIQVPKPTANGEIGDDPVSAEESGTNNQTTITTVKDNDARLVTAKKVWKTYIKLMRNKSGAHARSRQPIKIFIDEYRTSPQVSAFRVCEICPTDLDMKVPAVPFRTLHITVALAPDVPAVKANELFSSPPSQDMMQIFPLDQNTFVMGTLSAFT